jgi:DNA-binding transcriptional LysR family regulator
VGSGSRLNPTRLRVLYELARHGSIAGAADALWLTPSAVSQQIARLELETDTKLIEKAGRGVRLTTAGEILAVHASRVMAVLEDADAALRQVKTVPSGRLRLAALPSVVRGLLPGVIAGLRHSHPDLVLEVEDLEPEQGLQAARTGRVEVAIVDDSWGEGVSREGLEVVELFADPLVIVTAKGHPLGEHDGVPWSALEGEALILEQRSSLFAHTVESACRRAGFEPEVQCRVHDVGAMLALVRGGTLVGVLPELAVIGETRGIECRRLVPGINRRVLAVFRSDHQQRPTVGALLSALTTARSESFEPDDTQATFTAAEESP